MLQRAFSSFLVSLAFLLATVGTAAAEPGVLTISGNPRVLPNPLSIDVIAFEQEASRPIDPSTGIPSGATKQTAFKITKAVDTNSGALRQAFASGTPINVTFTFTTSAGDQYQASLPVVAYVTGIKTVLANTEAAASSSLPLFEEITILFAANASNGTSNINWQLIRPRTIPVLER
jgi:type VI protein secretion system component Hcp